ncbi:hypothetical protein JCM18916_3906 [Cutibacterium acnes JCM 18916]|nr:hypothetical protein JCM18916_3906 [Cutibacterium acnes JCM 18916]
MAIDPVWGQGPTFSCACFFLGRPTAGLRVSGCTFWGACSSQSHRSPPSLDEGTKEVTDVRSNPKKVQTFFLGLPQVRQKACIITALW